MSHLKLEIDDSRRLTGKNFLWQFPGAIMDAWVDGVDKKEVANCWQGFARLLLDGVGWTTEQTIFRIFEDGISVCLSAPIDALYAATDINECAWQLTCIELRKRLEPGMVPEEIEPLESMIQRLSITIADEINPSLLSLVSEAETHGAPWLADDDEFSLGYGNYSQVWPIIDLPTSSTLQWRNFKSVPTVYVTGTNGKSTTVRLTSAIMAEANLCCGVTSTDFIRVGETIIDSGDYSGPGGARTLLRHPGVEVALLEVARGGLLRRGLPVPNVDVALVTNIAEDHLGQYGINTLEALTQAKCIVAKGLDKNGILILNADDSNLVAYAEALPENEQASNISQKNICWFSLSKDNPVLKQYPGACCYLDQSMMVFERDGQRIPVIDVKDVPMCLNGAAKHNVQNALGAVAIAFHLDISVEAIRCGLMSFNSDVNDNPGRGNIFKYRGATVVVDFAHNVHSMDAMASTWGSMSSGKKNLLLCAAGDRSDFEIESMTRSALAMAPDHLVIAELPNYLRGRQPGEVSQVIAAAAKEHMPTTKLTFSDCPLSGAKAILDQIQEGELALLMALDQRDKIADLMN